jgi:hypothetical protein
VAVEKLTHRKTIEQNFVPQCVAASMYIPAASKDEETVAP